MGLMLQQVDVKTRVEGANYKAVMGGWLQVRTEDDLPYLSGRESGRNCVRLEYRGRLAQG
jgi:hypothetical protein